MVDLFEFADLAGGKAEKHPKAQKEIYDFKELEEIKFRQGKEGAFSLVYGQEKKIEGKRILEASKQKAEVMLEEAKSRVSGIEKEAYESGRQRAFADAQQKLEPVLEMFQQKINEVVEFKKNLFVKSENEILKLAISLASRIICHEVRMNEDVILSVIKSAAKKILGRKEITIRINPEDMEYVLQNKPKFKDEFRDIQQVSFKEDTSIGKGGCIIDTEYGSISAVLEDEFEEITKHLRKKLEIPPEEKKENGE